MQSNARRSARKRRDRASPPDVHTFAHVGAGKSSQVHHHNDVVIDSRDGV